MKRKRECLLQQWEFWGVERIWTCFLLYSYKIPYYSHIRSPGSPRLIFFFLHDFHLLAFCIMLWDIPFMGSSNLGNLTWQQSFSSLIYPATFLLFIFILFSSIDLFGVVFKFLYSFFFHYSCLKFLSVYSRSFILLGAHYVGPSILFLGAFRASDGCHFPLWLKSGDWES